MSQKTIPEQLSEALALIETQKTEITALNTKITTAQDQLATANTNLEAVRGACATLTTEKNALTTQLADATGKITAKDAEIANLAKARDDLAAKEQDIAKRADARAKELLAQVGQPAPSAVKPNAGGTDADKPQLSTLDSIAGAYRQKLGIS